MPNAQRSQRSGSDPVRRLHASSAASSAQQDDAHGRDDRAVSLAFPTFMVWGANTDVGKTLVSAGLAAAAARAQVCHSPGSAFGSARWYLHAKETCTPWRLL